jgi:hypothetical protein
MDFETNPLAALLQMMAQMPTQQAGTAVKPSQTPAFIPFGCTRLVKTLSDGTSVYESDSVDNLISWDDHVYAKDGGTFKGLKIKFIGVKPTNKSDKSLSSRGAWCARFEVSKAGGRNPLNEVVNIFVKAEKDYLPYMQPEKWSHKRVAFDFRSVEADEVDRKARLNFIYFDRELISDSETRKLKYQLDRLGGMYECYAEGSNEIIDLEDKQTVKNLSKKANKSDDDEEN